MSRTAAAVVDLAAALRRLRRDEALLEELAGGAPDALQVAALVLDYAPELVVELGAVPPAVAAGLSAAAARIGASTAGGAAGGFSDLLGDTRRVLLWWDLHSADLAERVLAEALPALAARDNLVLVHGIADARFEHVERTYERRGTRWQGHLVSSAAALVPLYDFFSRNGIAPLTASEALHALAAEERSELEQAFARLPGRASPLAGSGWLAFSVGPETVCPPPALGHAPVFSRFRVWEGTVEPGWLVNWLGMRTRTSVQTDMRGFPAPTRVRGELPPVEEEYFEWLDVLESVVEAGPVYTMVELGAGWGRWLVNAATALRQLDPERPFRLVGVEAEPTHFAWLRRHFADNGIDPGEHTLVNAAVAGSSGRVRFERGDPAGWYGQAIARDDPAARLAGPVSRLIRWTRNGAANRLALRSGAHRVRRARAVSLADLLAPLDRVDLIHADVQGVEADVFEPAAAELADKVVRAHVGTHDRENEARLRALFEGLGWERRFDYPGHAQHETPWGPVAFQDGIQSWLNPALRPRA